MKNYFKIILFITVIAGMILSCSKDDEKQNPVTVTQYVTNDHYIFIGFKELIGTWQDKDYGGKWIITETSFHDNGGGFYDLSAEITYVEASDNYFIIHITNNSTYTNQEGKYTKVHWKDYSTQGSKKQVQMAQHWPQADSLANAKTQSVSDIVSWSIMTNSN